ncbi:hypothetical protein AAG906_018479 [Vitis piasezkii]
MEPVQVHDEVTQEPQEPQVQVPPRRSTRERRSTISDDYVVYLQEHEFDMGMEDDPISINEINERQWCLGPSRVSEGVKPIGCKWIFKTKRDSKGNIVRIIMALVAHYNLKSHQMNVKTAFLNGNIDETIYMVQPENFESNDSKQLIYRDCSRGILGLSQKSYIDKVLSRFGMSNYAPGDTPVAKGDKFSLHQYPKNELEKKDMERFPYASVVGSLMYAQVCTRPDIAYIVGMLGRYLSNLGMDHWKKAKRVRRYLQRTKDYMLTYHRSSHLEIVGYLNSDFAGCLNRRRSTSSYIFMLAEAQFHGKVLNKHLLFLPPWRQNS